MRLRSLFRSTWFQGSIIGMTLSFFANACIPPWILDTWIRDADVGLWFCAGLFLSQLSIAGWLMVWQVSSFHLRCLSAVTICLVSIAGAWIGFRQTGPVSFADAFHFLMVTTLAPSTMAFCDLLCSWIWGYRIQRSQTDDNSASPSISIPIPSKPVDGSAVQTQTLHDEASSRAWDTKPDSSVAAPSYRFGLASLFAWMTLVGLATLILKDVAASNEIANRDLRITIQYEPITYTVARAVALLTLHLAMIPWTLVRRGEWRWWHAILCILFFLEVTRRIHFALTRQSQSYLEWNFAYLLLGFSIGQLGIGLTLRMLGWELGRRSEPIPNNVSYTPYTSVPTPPGSADSLHSDP